MDINTISKALDQGIIDKGFTRDQIEEGIKTGFDATTSYPPVPCDTTKLANSAQDRIKNNDSLLGIIFFFIEIPPTIFIAYMVYMDVLRGSQFL